MGRWVGTGGGAHSAHVDRHHLSTPPTTTTTPTTPTPHACMRPLYADQPDAGCFCKRLHRHVLALEAGYERERVGA